MHSRLHLARLLRTAFAILMLCSVLQPASADAQGDCNAATTIDSPTDGGTAKGMMTVQGWAVDQSAPTTSSGVESVHLYLDGEAGGTGKFLIAALVGAKSPTSERPELVRRDVDAALGRTGARAGWVADTDFGSVTPGAHTLYIYVETKCGWVFSRAALTVQPGPRIDITSPVSGASVTNGSQLTISGTATDPAGPGTGVDKVDVYIDGPAGTGTGIGRADYNTTTGAYSLSWTTSGLATGPHTIYVYANSVSTGWSFKTVTINVPGAPTSGGSSSTGTSTTGIIRVESPPPGIVASGPRTFTGYAVDCSDGSAATRVRVYEGTNATGTFLGDASVRENRDVGQYCNWMQRSADVGYAFPLDTRRLTDGRHSLAFVAEFATGSAIATTDINVDNVRPGGTCISYTPSGSCVGYGGVVGGNDNCAYTNGYNGPVYTGVPQQYDPALCVNNPYSTACTGSNAAAYCNANPTVPSCVVYGDPNYCMNNPYAASCSSYGTGSPCVINVNCGYNPDTVNCQNTPNAAGCVNYNLNCTGIVLDQANQTLPTNATVTLSGTAYCGLTDTGGGISTVQISDRTNGANTPINNNFRLTANSVYSASWNTSGVVGTRTIFVVATGSCGTMTQQFILYVGAPGAGLSAPFNVVITGGGTSAVTLTWTPVSSPVSNPAGIVGYNVFQSSTGVSTSYQQVQFVAGPGSSTATIGNLTPNQPYFFYVTSVAQGGGQSQPSNIVSSTNSGTGVVISPSPSTLVPVKNPGGFPAGTCPLAPTPCVVRFVFTTNLPTNAVIRWGTVGAGLPFQASDLAIGTNHVIDVTFPSPGTYEWRVDTTPLPSTASPTRQITIP